MASADRVAPIVRMAALRGEGVGDLVDALARHEAFCCNGARAGQLREERRQSELVEIIRARISAEVDAEMRVQARDPYTVAEELVGGALGALKR